MTDEDLEWVTRELFRDADAMLELRERVRIVESLSHWEQQRDRSARNAGGWMEPSPPQEPR